MKIVEKLNTVSFSQVVLYGSLFAAGIFHEYLSCALSIVLLLWLAVRLCRHGSLRVPVTLTGIAVAVLVGAYAVTALWAIDSGAAIFGFFKFLPLLLYTLVLLQEEDGQEKVLNGLPYVVAVMTVLSLILMYIPGLSTYFAVAGRLSGFVQYPNTFAMILLVAELLLLTKERPLLLDFVCIALLLFGILYTGSRTVLILTAVANVAGLLINKNRKVRLITLGCMALGIVAVLLYCLVTDSFAVLTRYLNITTQASTFVGRILYAHDALPVVLRHPFGIGYMGYYYIQQSIQTGMYAIKYVHNDLLQILLDVGWLPCLLLLAAVVKTLLSKTFPLRYKLILVIMLMHACFDFDLQYVAVFMLLLLFMEQDEKKVFTLTQRRTGTVTAALLLCLCTYMGVVQALSRFDRHEAVAALYPHSTLSDIELLKDTTDAREQEAIADRIIKHNSHVSVAYSVKARSAYSKGDFRQVIEYKNKAIEVAPFTSVEYWEYGNMLVTGIKLYEQAGDTASAAVCKRELLALEKRLLSMGKKVSTYGARIDTQPKLYFPTTLDAYIQAYKNEE